MSELNITAPVASAPRSPGAERRARLRYSWNLPAALRTAAAEPTDAAEWLAARVHDISGDGLGLALTHAIEPGTLLTIDLEGVARMLLAHVVHTTLRPGGGWIVGCKLMNPLTEVELKALL
jgi:hypothetical protein